MDAAIAMTDADLLNASRRAIAGELRIAEWFRSIPKINIAEIRPAAAAIVCRGLGANVTALRTPAGLLVCDSGSLESRDLVFEALRSWDRDTPVHTIVFTHGHFDHVHGALLYDREAQQRGWPRPRVIAQENILRRFDRYVRTAGLNELINRRQYSRPGFQWPVDYRRPDLLVHESLVIDMGGETIELYHGRGETDDHLWVWAPRQQLVVAGDFFIWAAPNAGNPQKVQRYAGDWAVALRAMQAKAPLALVGGHGPPLVGGDIVDAVLGDTAAWLESIHDQTVALLNCGARLDEILHSVKPPAALSARPYLHANYDDPEFVVRNICRLYGGWWDGNPAHLKPARETELATELADLCGGTQRLIERAQQLLARGELRLAGHLAELAVLAAPADRQAHATRAQVNTLRAQDETSQMAKGIFRAAAAESQARADG